MLYAFGFDRVGVVVSDLYFVNPRPEPGQEGPEQGVRLEVRVLERGAPPGSIYSARPILVDRPVWRADLLESVANPGTLDRAHHHPRFDGWEPGRRHFDDALSADPVGWVGRRLGDLESLLADAGVEGLEPGTGDVAGVREATGEIMGCVDRLLARVRGAGAGPAAGAAGPGGVRLSWL